MPKLTPTEVAILFALMAEAGPVSNLDLKERYAFTLTGEARRKLNEGKLVQSHKQGNAFTHELTEVGWARCREELSAPSSGGGTAGGAFNAVLRGLGRYLDRADLSLADIFRPAPAALPVVPAAVEADLEADIRSAYRRLARRSGDWVSLTALRPLLGGDREAIDRVLIGLRRSPQVSLVPEDNQKTLTPADRAAAVLIGGREHHFLAMEYA